MTSRFAALALSLLPLLAHAGVLIPSEPGSQPLTLRRQSLRISVQDQVARAVVDEVFENHTDKPIEAQYLLPLPTGAAISGFATWTEGKRVEARIEEKKEADRTYEQAKAQGSAPAILDGAVKDAFRTRVDGIPPNGTKRIEASFAQILPYDAGLVTMRVPLAVVGSSGQVPVGSFQVIVDVADQKRIRDLTVASHPAKVDRISDTSWRVTLSATDVVPGEALVMQYHTESSKLGLTFATYRPDANDDGYFLLMASPQELTTEADIVQKDVVFVFDTSGSMQSESKIEQARQALKSCLSKLNAGDHFGIIAFSDAINPYRNDLVPASAENIADAQLFAEKLSASGGTNIHGAMMRGFELFAASDRPRVMLMMTDGQPSVGIIDPEGISSAVKAKNSRGARVFTFGVGSDVNRVLLEKVGRENRGGVDFVNSSQTIEAVVAGFYSRIAKPVLSDVSMKFDGITVANTYPDQLPDMYKGSQLVMVGRYRGDGTAQSRIEGTLNSKRITLPFEAKFPKVATEDAFVARLWAQSRIDFLLAQARINGENAEAHNEVIALSRRYQILTPYTSLVATPNPRLAMVSPGRVKPGDPVVEVRAPADAQVLVRLPSFGVEKRARWDERLGVFKARFLIPSGTPDGSYAVWVDIAYADGRRERREEQIAVDTEAPAFNASVRVASIGAPLRLSAQAVIAPSEVIRVLTMRDDRVEGMKALIDVKQVSARLWDGREVRLGLKPGVLGFTAMADSNSSMKPGRYPIVFTAQDFAGNTAQQTVFVEVQ